ncbi:hypothetical protein C8F04DRAFT_1253506 [Mycena alexandri]|uniref:Uncharacterized protein n=1 Tax=Mycena alexandri TaxID=1745969 RepID=A0AAD6X6N2_9AGAR|nr:hypothetical protein C8F04DRAFT_1253506 [Mycena alexandri]
MFPGRFTPNDVDVYTPETEETLMLEILREQLGFTVTKQVATAYPKRLSITRIYWLTKGTAKINLITVKGDNAVVPIFQFHSTLVMNKISCYGMFCAYPELTLNGIALVNTGVKLDTYSKRRTAECIEKYEKRGFTFKDQLGDYRQFHGHRCGENANCQKSVRTLGDGQGLFVPFTAHTEDKEGQTHTTVNTADGTNSVEWSLGGLSCNGEDFMDGVVNSVTIKSESEGEAKAD